MKNKIQKNSPASNKKAHTGLPRELRNESENINRSNSRNSDRSREMNNRDEYAEQNDEQFYRRDSRNSTIQYSGRGNQYGQYQQRSRNNADFDDEYNQQHVNQRDQYYDNDYDYSRDKYEPEDYHEQHRQRPGSEQYPLEYKKGMQQVSDKRQQGEHYRENYNSRYGEHPASRGAEEYQGGNKRHSGSIRDYPNNDRDLHRKSYRDEDDYFSDNRDEERPLNRNNQRNHTVKEYSGYMNRAPFEQQLNRREIYDPVQNEYENQSRERNAERERLYLDEGYQSYGNVEGFGRRSGVEHGQDWLEDDEYRHGHAQRKRGYGKYGSR